MSEKSVSAQGFSFLKDEPAAEDSFGPHSKLASAIGQLISDDPEIKIIGILGPWGSGKSTVVRAIESQLRGKSKKVHFFTYDAWLHQSDPVRRSFLESLVGFLGQNGMADPEKWQKRLEELNGTVERTETETAPVLTTSGTLILSSLALVPFGVALLGYDAVKDAVADPPSRWAAGVLAAGIGLSLAPAIAALVMYLAWRPWGTKIFTRAFWSEHKSPHEKESILGILTDRKLDRVLSVTARQPEPTSIEFQQLFRELMTEAVREGHNFIFIIDNLDRLAEKEALQIWSAVRAFFLDSSDMPLSKKLSYLPTVILPVDANSIRRMFAVEHGDQDAKDLSRAFMDKTFDITFDVPEPVMSDWQDYLSKQAEKCFGSLIQESDIYWITRFLDDKRRSKGGLATTPRSINKYINHIAALYAQRSSSEIDVPTLAFYAAFSHLIQEGVLDLIQIDGPSSVPPSPNWKVQVAAIHYGVPLPKARQILLSDPIRDAIQQLDHETFRELRDIPGFSTELRRVLSNPVISQSGGEPVFGFVTNAALLIGGGSLSNEHWLAETWQLLSKQYLESTNPGKPPADLKARIEVFLANAPPEIRRRLLDVSSAKISGMINDANINQPTAVAIGAADRLILEARSWGLDEPWFAPALVPPNFLVLLSRSVTAPNFWRRLKSTHKMADLGPILADNLRNSTSHAIVPPCIRIILDKDFVGIAKPVDGDWDGVITVASDLLRNQSGSLANVGSAAESLGLLQRHSNEAAASVVGIINEGHLVNRLNEAFSAGEQAMLAAGLSFNMAKGADFAAPAGASWPNFLEKFSQAPSRIATYLAEFFGPVIAPTIWGALDRAPSARPLILAVIDHLLSNAGLGSLNVDKVVAEIASYLKPLTPAQQRPFVFRLKNYAGFWNELEHLQDNAIFLQVARILKSGAADDQEKVKELVRNRLASATPEQWKLAIEKGGSLYALATVFATECPELPAKSGLHAALISYGSLLVATRDRNQTKRWFTLTRNLVDSAGKKVVASVADLIAQGGHVGDLLALLRESDGKLLSSGNMKPEAIVRTVILPLLDTGPGRKWVENHYDKLKPSVSKSAHDAIAGLRNEVDRLARSSSKGRQEDAARLRKLFGFK
jgi:Cdc6-like AAA superfamily ATPase